MAYEEGQGRGRIEGQVEGQVEALAKEAERRIEAAEFGHKQMRLKAEEPSTLRA